MVFIHGRENFYEREKVRRETEEKENEKED